MYGKFKVDGVRGGASVYIVVEETMGDDEPTTLEEYRRLTPHQRKSIKKPALQGILDTIASDDEVDASGATVVQKLNEILREIKDMKEKNRKYEDDIKRLNDVINDQNKVLAAQQKFLETVDADRRGENLIVLGLAENEAPEGNDEESDKYDEEQFNLILRAIEVAPNSVQIRSIERLGKLDEGVTTQRRRPMKVTFESRTMRDNILRNASKLKDQGERDPFKRVFLKRDIHPDIRREEKRLYEVFKAERDKPQNADLDVVFDRKKRVVTVNGDEVDRFKLFTSFQ